VITPEHMQGLEAGFQVGNAIGRLNQGAAIKSQVGTGSDRIEKHTNASSLRDPDSIASRRLGALRRMQVADPRSIEAAMSEYDYWYPASTVEERRRVKNTILQRNSSNPFIRQAMEGGESLYMAAFRNGVSNDAKLRSAEARARSSETKYQTFQRVTQPAVDSNLINTTQRGMMRLAAPGMSLMDRVGGLWDSLFSGNSEANSRAAEQVYAATDHLLSHPRSTSPTADLAGIWRTLSSNGGPAERWNAEMWRVTLHNLNPLESISLVAALTRPSSYVPPDLTTPQWKSRKAKMLNDVLDLLLGNGAGMRVAKGDPSTTAQLAGLINAKGLELLRTVHTEISSRPTVPRTTDPATRTVRGPNGIHGVRDAPKYGSSPPDSANFALRRGSPKGASSFSDHLLNAQIDKETFLKRIHENQSDLAAYQDWMKSQEGKAQEARIQKQGRRSGPNGEFNWMHRSGIEFVDGYPNHEGFVEREANVRHTGDRKRDVRLANKEVGQVRTPAGRAWDHNGATLKMEQVPDGRNRSAGHKGMVYIDLDLADAFRQLERQRRRKQ
jgi:hypothetical protein